MAGAQTLAATPGQSPFLLCTGPVVVRVTSPPPSTPPLAVCPQSLHLAGVTKNLAPVSGSAFGLQSDFHLLRCLIPGLRAWGPVSHLVLCSRSLL